MVTKLLWLGGAAAGSYTNRVCGLAGTVMAALTQ